MVCVKNEARLECKLEVLSPVHIGTGNTFNLWDFAIRGNHLCILNQDEFFEFLNQKKKLGAAISSMESGQGKADDFLDTRIPDNLIRYKINIHTSVNPQRINKVLEAIKNLKPDHTGKLKPLFYIPATEIKGYIRTAIIYCYMRDNWSNFQSQFPRINKRFNFKTTIEERIFGNATEDPMKYLKIEDVYGDFEVNVIGVRIRFSSRNFVDNAEVITAGRSDLFKVKIDEGRLKGSMETYIKDWRKCCFEFTRDVLSAEIKFWEDVKSGAILHTISDQRVKQRFSGDQIKKIASDVIRQLEKIQEQNSKDTPVIRIGRFTGYLFHTVSSLLNRNVRRYTHHNQPYNIAPIGNHIGARNAKSCLFPLTRRLTLDNKTLGWCRLVT